MNAPGLMLIYAYDIASDRSVYSHDERNMRVTGVNAANRNGNRRDAHTARIKLVPSLVFLGSQVNIEYLWQRSSSHWDRHQHLQQPASTS